MSLSLVVLKASNLKLLSMYYTMLNKLHTQPPLNRHMNGGKDIHVNTYKESQLDSHLNDLVRDNMAKVTLATH